MNVRNWLSGLSLIACGTCCLADEPLKEAVLGRAEPIGTLTTEISQVTAKALTRAEAVVVQRRIQQVHPTNTAVVQVGGSIAKAIQTAQGTTTSKQTAGVIQRHMHQTIQLLDAAGLADEAMKVEAILSQADSKLVEFESRHRDRLALAMKHAELERLKQEIEELNSRILTASELSEDFGSNDEDAPQVLPVDFEIPSVGPSLLPQ